MPPAAATTKTVARVPGSQIQVTTTSELMQLAEILYAGGLSPPNVDNPKKVAAVILAGYEVGLAPTQALGSIMLTNGRLSIYGDGAMALVRASGLLESIEEWVDGEGDDRTGHCKLKRRGEPERHYTFSIREANKAGLIERAKGKGPWATFPDRMLIMRPRGFGFRDIFADVLRGLVLYEEAQDMGPAAEPVQATVISATPNVQPVALPPAPTQLASPPVAHTAPAPAPEPLTAPPTTVAVAAEVRPAPITEAQIKMVVMIRQGVWTERERVLGRPLTDEERDQTWTAFLAEYCGGITSARELSEVAAAAFIARFGPAYDLFTPGQTGLPPGQGPTRAAA